MTDIISAQIPRPPVPHEMPRDMRDLHVNHINSELLLRMEKIERQAMEIERDIGNMDARETRTRERIRAASAEARSAGRPLSRAEYARLRAQDVLARSAFQQAYYAEAQEIAHRLNRTAPDIDQVTPMVINPGGGVELDGTCFGRSQGKVFLEPTAGKVIELEVGHWSDTCIEASINPLFAQVPLRPYQGRIWINTGEGVTSNIWPIQYVPVYSEYIAQWTKSLRGHGGGNHEDGILLENCGLGDPDFTIIQVDHSHSGKGWSEKRYPFADGRSMAQGYHIGVDWFGEATMNLLYAIRGPKGIDPPYFEPLGDWTWIGDL